MRFILKKKKTFLEDNGIDKAKVAMKLAIED